MGFIHWTKLCSIKLCLYLDFSEIYVTNIYVNLKVYNLIYKDKENYSKKRRCLAYMVTHSLSIDVIRLSIFFIFFYQDRVLLYNKISVFGINSK